jgi:hypothetical protein
MDDLSVERLFILGKIGKSAYNLCRASGLLRLSSIYEYSQTHDFSEIEGCGERTRKQLQALCYLYAKSLESSELGLQSEDEVHVAPNNVGVRGHQRSRALMSSSTTIETLIECERISVRSYNCCKKAGLITLGQIVSFGEEPFAFYKLRGAGDKTVKELEGLCGEYNNFLTVGTLEDGDCEEGAEDMMPACTDSPIAKLFFQKEFERLRQSVSLRGQHLCETVWLRYEDLFPYFDCSYEDFAKRFKGKKKSYSELFNILIEFRYIYQRNKDKSDKEFEALERERLFPFLMDRELEFVSSFYAEYLRYPMLYILKSYFAVSSDRTDSLYAYKFGILTGEHKTREEVAKAYQLTSERVRQLIQGYKLNTSMDFAALSDWDYYIEKAPCIITKNSLFYKELSVVEEIIEGYDAFIGLICCLLSYRKIRRKNEKIFVKTEYENDARAVLESLSDAIETKYVRDTVVPLTSIIGNKKSSLEIAMILLPEVFGISVDEDGTIVLEQGRVDVSAEIVDVLETFGHPMSVDDIFMFFKDKYPNHKYENPLQLRPAIINSEDIVALGKTGMYALKQWNLFTGTIRDCAYMILMREPEPLSDDLLVEKVKEHFPNSTFRSIISTLVSDPKGRFAHYTDLSMWVAEKDHLTRKIKIRPKICSETRFEDLQDFLATYRRWPFASGGDEESSLSRWIYNHSRRDLLPGFDPEEAAKIKELQKEYSHYPHNNLEYEFQNLCSDYRVFVEKNFRLPEEIASLEKEVELASWFYKVLSKREPYADNRQLYFSQLLDYLAEYGFYFK